MLRIGFLATDLDGTLLKSDKSLPSGAKYVFNYMSELDIKTALISARPYRLAKEYANKLDCDYLACNNGAEIYKKDELVYQSRLDGEFVREFTARICSLFPRAMIGAEYEGALYANYDMYTSWTETECERCDFPKYPFPAASKLLIGVGDSSGLARLASLVEYDDVHYELANGVAIITTANASKENAFKRMAFLSDTALSDSVAFGDGLGDIEMLKCAGIGFCTTNGHPMAKRYADQIIDSNDDEGVIKAIKEYVI